MENSHLWFSECRKVTTHKCLSINVNGNGISVLAIMKKLKNGCHFVNIDLQKNFKLLTPLKLVHSFPSVHENGISVLAIMKKLKNGCHFINIDHTEKNFKLLTTQKLDLQFSKCQQKWNISVGHCEKILKMATIS